MCQLCCRGLYCDGIRYVSDVQVHHIVPLAKDYSKKLDGENLICLCPYHHEMAESGEIPENELLLIANEQENKDPPCHLNYRNVHKRTPTAGFSLRKVP